jgi:FkbM family methyltransferase
MVEPDPRNYKVIMEGMQLNPNRRLIPAAIAAQDGIRIFRRSTDSRDGSRGSGSILEPTGHLEHFPTIAFDDGFEVKCYTLDRIFRENQLDHIDLLYVDIQGA